MGIINDSDSTLRETKITGVKMHHLDYLKLCKFGFPKPIHNARWILEARQHVEAVSYYQNLRGVSDPEDNCPHDSRGVGGKFSVPNMFYFSNQYTEVNISADYLKQAYHKFFVKPGYEIHRFGESHHKHWHEDEVNFRKNLENSCIDVVRAFREKRAYNGGEPTPFKNIPKAYMKSLESRGKKIEVGKLSVLEDIVKWMESLQEPKVELIINPENSPNIGMKEEDFKVLNEIVSNSINILEAPNWWNYYRGWNIRGFYQDTLTPIVP